MQSNGTRHRNCRYLLTRLPQHVSKPAGNPGVRLAASAHFWVTAASLCSLQGATTQSRPAPVRVLVTTAALNAGDWDLLTYRLAEHIDSLDMRERRAFHVKLPYLPERIWLSVWTVQRQRRQVRCTRMLARCCCNAAGTPELPLRRYSMRCAVLDTSDDDAVVGIAQNTWWLSELSPSSWSSAHGLSCSREP